MIGKVISRSLHEVVIVSAVRTPMGSFCSSMSSLSAIQLGSIAIKDAVTVRNRQLLTRPMGVNEFDHDFKISHSHWFEHFQSLLLSQSPNVIMTIVESGN